MASPQKTPNKKEARRFVFARRSALSLAIQSASWMLVAGTSGFASHAHAAEAAENVQTYAIPAGPLGQTLSAFAARAGVSFSFDAGLTEARSSKGINGRYSVSGGFAHLLEGSGLQVQRLTNGGFTLQALPVVAKPVAATVPVKQQESVPQDLPAIDVVAQRMDSNLIRPTRQVTVIEREELNELRQASTSVATLLSKVVPGMADSSRTITDFGQTLRGRNMLVLVDGIPINTNRDSSRNLATINLGSIQRVEVLRGSSAIYGAGATGGIVAITTRPAGGEPYAETTVSLNSSLSKLRADGVGGEINHFMSGSNGVVDYAFNIGLQHIGGSYDGHGDRIAPEPSQGDLFDSNNYAIGGKLGFRIDRDQRLQLSISRYVADQDTDYASDPSVAKLPLGSAVAKPIKGLKLDDQNQIRNTLVSGDYQNTDFFGSELSAQLYYRDYFTRFTPFDARALANRGKNIDQVMQNSNIFGGRLTLTTPIVESTKLVWGLDFNQERSDMPDDVFNKAVYDSSGGTVFQKTGRVTYMPELTTRTIGAFGQLQHKLNEQWSFEGGVRYERSRAEFDDFVSLLESTKPTPGTVEGGTIKYDAWLYNLGTVFKPIKNHEMYAAFSQGFQLPDVGLVIRNAQANFDIGSVKPVKTDNYELGWRGTFGDVLGTLAIFQTTSKLGDVQSINNGLILLRTREKIQGIEGSLDYLPAGNWGGGATLTYIEGRETPSGKPDQDMTGYRIPPLKVTAYVQYKPNEQWSNRLQATYFGSRDYRLKGVESFGRREVDSYTTVDLISRYAFTKKDSVTVGVENLFDRYYLPAYSQLMRNSNNTSRLPATGAVLSVMYNHVW
ncbi:MAG TPA: TonB-dependent receptor [Oxalicibacterium sp.]|uniref:TonB-dependent receptor n=1 Tax=Oxalicibacterium sp. TaxID=2766525 RepID=UPI002C68B14C|nr:TonB-dependent receptor [Oxalicibacterium sp.]HWU97484.1 TonB-dependent receptor [Oxalicibacterium sp.]